MTPDSHNPHVQILQQVSIFQGLDRSTLVKIGEALRPVQFSAQQEVFRKGDQGTSMFIIVRGEVMAHDGHGHVFGHMRDGQFFGEYALLDTEARSASITAVTDVEALRLQQADFYEILGNNIDVVKSMLQVFTKRLRTNNALQEELASSNRKIQQQKEQIEAQHKELAVKNEKITSSINYAKRIQAVMLPSIPTLRQAFRDLFILYKPRDIVSGDFYWFTEAHGKSYFAVADCTGHGVPGALMSMTGAMLLNHVIKEKGVESVDGVLKELHLGVANLLNAKESNVQDGMDIALCCIDRERKILSYSGAKQALLYIENGEAVMIKPNKEPIGGSAYQYYRTYDRHDIELRDGMTFYISSDGYQDQFNKAGQKFLRKRMRELLIEIHQRPLEEQAMILDRSIEDWKKGTEQTDDILVAGFKV
jgi:serine phosphatase RsbU (regulator of sigma subunit)